MNKHKVRKILKTAKAIKLPDCTYCRTISCWNCAYFETHSPDSKGQCRCSYKGRWYYPHEGCTNGITRQELLDKEAEERRRKQRQSDYQPYPNDTPSYPSNNQSSYSSYDSSYSSGQNNHSGHKPQSEAGPGSGFCGCAVLILILLCFLESWAIDVGIFKSDITFRLDVESTVSENNVPDALTLVHSEADNRAYTVTFDDTGEANCKIRKGSYTQYLIEDRMAFSYHSQYYSGESKRTEKIPEVTMDGNLLNTLILTVQAAGGQTLTTDDLTVSTQSGDILPATPYGSDGTYIVLLFDKDMSDSLETLTVSAPGYEAKEIKVNFKNRRVCEKNIKLSKE